MNFGSLVGFRRFFLSTADVLGFPVVFCFCQSCAGLRILDLDVTFRISSHMYENLWASGFNNHCFEQVGKESMNLFRETEFILLFFYYCFSPLLYRTLL